MQFNIKVQNDFKNNIRREWALTNGLGGYAGGSVTGAINRTHQGYLIASLHAPVQRYVCFSKTNEKIVTDSHTYDLQSATTPIIREQPGAFCSVVLSVPM